MTTPRASQMSDFIDDTPTIIEYIWCGENVGLELVRPPSTEAKKTIKYAWTSGTDMGFTLVKEFNSKQVIVKRVTKTNEPALTAKCILHSVNGTQVKMENYNEIMVVLKSGHEAGITQEMEFLPCPSPVMVKSIPPGGVLEQAGVSTEYELISINNIDIIYLTMSQIGRMLTDSTKPCHLTFGLLPRNTADELADRLAGLSVSDNDIVRV